MRKKELWCDPGASQSVKSVNQCAGVRGNRARTQRKNLGATGYMEIAGATTHRKRAGNLGCPQACSLSLRSLPAICQLLVTRFLLIGGQGESVTPTPHSSFLSYLGSEVGHFSLQCVPCPRGLWVTGHRTQAEINPSSSEVESCAPHQLAPPTAMTCTTLSESIVVLGNTCHVSTKT